MRKLKPSFLTIFEKLHVERGVRTKLLDQRLGWDFREVPGSWSQYNKGRTNQKIGNPLQSVYELRISLCGPVVRIFQAKTSDSVPCGSPYLGLSSRVVKCIRLNHRQSDVKKESKRARMCLIPITRPGTRKQMAETVIRNHGLAVPPIICRLLLYTHDHSTDSEKHALYPCIYLSLQNMLSMEANPPPTFGLHRSLVFWAFNFLFHSFSSA